jgi:signal transduction histidine kinase/CheY-like chemotaxis protein/NO-binding membrane sensor protein with MHYT domain/HPt (histidine-containing phosphotransfer) domain-containing protein
MLLRTVSEMSALIPDWLGHLSLFLPIAEDGILYAGRFNRYLMLAAELVAVIGFYAVFSALEFVRANNRQEKTFRVMQWAVGAALGLCMWIVHFISLIGYVLPVEVAYDLSLTAWSVLPVMLGSALAIHTLFKHDQPSLIQLSWAGLCWVLGMLVTYVLGVSAIDFAGMVRAEWLDVQLWGLGAWLMATLALGLPGWANRWGILNPPLTRAFSCLISGTLVYAIHVYGMEITTYMTDPTADLIVEGHDPIWLASVVMGAAALMGTSSWLLFMRSFLRKIARSNMLLNQTLELTHSGHWEYRSEDQTMLLSKQAAEMFGIHATFDTTLIDWNQWLLGVEKADPTQARTCQSKIDELLTKRSTNVQWTFPYRLDERNEVIWLSSVGAAVQDTGGNETHYYFAIQDVTEEYLLKQELKESKLIADSANKTKGEFLANMSHEIRTPMNAILGLTELSLRQPLSPKVNDYLGKVHLAAKNLLGIINDILDLSKVESGKMELEITDFNLDDVLDNLSTVLATSIEQKGLELLFHRSPDVEVRLKGDPLRLGQVLLNLCGNARKFTEQGSIVVKVIAVQKDVSQSRLRFEIIDTGIGMTPEQVNKLFQPFSQADASTTRKYGGTGLGLAISKQLVELMGGQIGLSSVPGVGSTFHFEIPLQHGEIHPSDDLLIKKIQNMKVLVVDDNPLARDVLSAHLLHFRCHVECCETADLALPLIKKADSEDPFELILMDYRMPGTDGIHAAKIICEDDSLKNRPPIILVTAASHFDDAENIDLHQCVKDVLHKPVNASMLFDSIMNVLGIETMRSHQPAQRQTVHVEGLERIKGAQILLAEDNPINQEVAKEFLATMGLLVHVVNNGQEALDALKQKSYDLVLMDVQMPVMDGYTAASEIRRNPAWTELPVIAMTANVMAEDKKTALLAGMNDHVAKPIVMSQLQSVLIKWLKNYKPDLTSQSKEQVTSQEPLGNQLIKLPEDQDDFKVSEALNLMGGNHKLLFKLLNEFAQDHGLDVQKFKQLIEKGMRIEAERLVHTMKGLAGMLCARSLQSSSLALEIELKHELLLQSDLRITHWENEFNKIMIHLQTWRSGLNTLEPVMTQKLDETEIAAMINELQKCLEEFNPDAEDLAKQLIQSDPDHENIWSIISQKAHDFDFESAISLLHEHRGIQ